MKKPNSTMARQIAEAASRFEQQRTGNTPKSVTVVLSDTTLVITLHGALSEAEKALAKSPEGAAQIQDFHRQLFASGFESLRQEIKRITGVLGQGMKGPAKTLVPFAHRSVEVRGKLFENGGVRYLDISSIQASDGPGEEQD